MQHGRYCSGEAVGKLSMDMEQSLNELKSTLLQFCNRIGQRDFAVATNVIDIKNFYIVPLDCYKLMYKLEVPGHPLEIISEYCIVVYKSTAYKRFIRGRVLKVNGDGSCDIFAMDYGITEMSVEPSEIFSPAVKEVVQIPDMALHCELSRCYPRGKDEFSDDDQNSFKYYMGQPRERLTITIKDKIDDKLSVLVMSSMSNPDDVSTMMSYMNQTNYFNFPM